METKWYPRPQVRQTQSEVESTFLQAKRNPPKSLCPCCSGKGLVIDANSGYERGCVGCRGTGRIKRKTMKTCRVCWKPAEGKTNYCATHNRLIRKAEEEEIRNTDKREKQLLKAKLQQSQPKKAISRNPKDWSNTFICSDGTKVTQVEINERRAEAYDKAYPGWREHPKTCHGCWKRKQQGFAHIIAQARCKQLGKTELIWEPKNFFPADIQCNSAIESPNGKNWKALLNITECLEFIKLHDPTLYSKFEGNIINQERIDKI